MGKKIREGHHSAITDARTTLALYKIKYKKMAEFNVNILKLKIERPPKDLFDSILIYIFIFSIFENPCL